MNSISKGLMLCGIVLCLAQVWLPWCYLTGDGPCHVYNAQVLHDFMAGKNIGFYSRFYELGHTPNPNWMAHLILATLMFAVNGVVAEKILVSGYLLLFLSGAYSLLKRLGNGNSYWPLLVFIFVFNRLLVAGFYNFSISVALFFWLIEVWLSCLEKRGAGRLLLFCLLIFLIYFSHPIAFVFGCFTCFAVTGSYILSALSPVAEKKNIKFLVNRLLLLTACFAPCLILFTRFTMREGGLTGIHLHLFQYRFHNLLRPDYLVNYTFREAAFIKYMAGIFCILFPVSIIIKYRKGFRVHKYDGFLMAALFVLFVYKCFPETLLGGGSLSIRAKYFFFIFSACCISYMLPSEKVKNVVGLILYGCFIFLCAGRIKCLMTASAGEADYMGAIKFIKPYSVILPLNFSPNGTDAHGNMIADNMYIYSHASEYMGTKKPLIILDNYEATQGYFPFTWIEKVDPYHHLSAGEGIEGWPPYALIDNYRQTSGVTIDYILMWCYNPSYLKNEHFNKLYHEILSSYHRVYTSPTARTILYEKN